MLLARIQLDVGRQVGGSVTVVPVVLPFSRANWLAAASIWRRLLMQALACEVARAFTKFGDRDGRQKADDGHDDHDFHQREARLAEVLGLFSLCFAFSFHGREQRSRRVI